MDQPIGVYGSGGRLEFSRVGDNVYHRDRRVFYVDGSAVYDQGGVRRFYIVGDWWYGRDGVARYYHDSNDLAQLYAERADGIDEG